MQLSDDFVQKWDHIISSVDKTNVPLECINKMVIRLQGNKQRTINLQRLRKQGYDFDAIEEILNQHLKELENKICDIDFMVDVVAVAQLIQPETDKLLRDL